MTTLFTGLLAALCMAAGVHGATLPDISTPLRTGARSPADAAVVIGLESYPFVADVPYAVADARVMYDFLVYTRGIPADRVRIFDSGANREQILEAVTEAGEQVGPGGVVWIYFAGHGAADTSTGERVLLGDDVRGDTKAFVSRGVKVKDIKDLASAGGGSVHLLVDACYAGVGRAGEELVAGKRFLVPTYATEPSPRIMEWNAAGPDQLSGPLDQAGHGAFTYLVLGALRGWADGHLDGVRDGKVTAEEASLFVNQALKAMQVTEQRSVLTATDPNRLVLSGSETLEEGPPMEDLLLAIRGADGTPTGAAAPMAGPLNVDSRAGITAWLDQVVTNCYHRHGGGHEDLRQWWVRFKVHPTQGMRGLMVNTTAVSESPDAHAIYSCMRGEIRERELVPPARTVKFSGYVNAAPQASEAATADETAESGAASPPKQAAPTVTEASLESMKRLEHEARRTINAVAPSPEVLRQWEEEAARAGDALLGKRPVSEPPREAVPDPTLVIRAPSGDWLDVRVDGLVVAEFRNEREHRVALSPGVHTVEFVKFMDDEPFVTGRLDTGRASEIIFGFEADKGVTCYNHDGWQER